MSEEDIKIFFETMGIKSQVETSSSQEESYLWNGLKISITENGIYKITGNIPVEVSRILAKQYADERNNIYINLEYKNTKSNLNDNLVNKENGERGVESYFIRGARALTCLLIEIEYFHKNGVYDENLRRRFKNIQREILEEVDSCVLKKISPNLDLETWAAEYERPLPKSDTINKLGDLVERFHEVVNPYGSKNHVVLSTEEMGLDKMFVTPSKKEKFSSIIFNAGTCASTYIRSFEPSEEELRYELQYQDGEEMVDIVHVITADGTCNVIRVLRNSRESMQEEDYSDDAYDIYFNIEEGTCEIAFSSMGEMTMDDDDIDLLKFELKNAIDVGTKAILSKVARNSKGRLKKKRTHYNMHPE